MINLNESSEAQALLTAAVHSIARTRGTERASTAVAWNEMASVCGWKSSEELRRFRATLSDHSVEEIAALAVTEGLLGQSWLREWLLATRHANPLSVVEKLFVGGWPRGLLSPHVNPRLKNRIEQTGTEIERKFTELRQVLKRQASVIQLYGDIGTGTSSALYSIAKHYYQEIDLPVYAYIVWIDLKDFLDEPDQNALTESFLFDIILDEILLTANTPSIVDMTSEQKRSAVAHLVWQSPLLLVLDHFYILKPNNPSYSEILEWISGMPYPSKVLISTQHKTNELHNSIITIPLRNLDPVQETQFRSRLEQDFNLLPSESLEIYRHAQGNIRSARLLAAYYRFTSRPLNPVDDMRLDTLIKRNCHCLSPIAQKILLCLIPFPGGYIKCTPLFLLASQATEWPDESIETFEVENWFVKGLEELSQLELVELVIHEGKIDGVRWDNSIRDAAKELFITFTDNLETFYDSVNNLDIAAARLFISFASQVGYCPDNNLRLKRLDEHMYIWPDVIRFIATHDNKELRELAIRLSAGLSYFFYVRGHWSRYISPHLVAYRKAVEILRDENFSSLSRKEVLTAALKDLGFEIEWLVKRGNFQEIEQKQYWKEVSRLKNMAEVAPLAHLIERSTYAFYLMNQENANYRMAERVLTEAIQIADEALVEHDNDTDSTDQVSSVFRAKVYLDSFRYLAYYRLAQCVAQRDPDLAIRVIQDFLGFSESDKRTGTRLKIFQITLELEKLESNQSIDGRGETLDKIKDTLMELGNVVALNEGVSLSELLDLSRSNLLERDLMDPTEVAYFLKTYGHYLALHRDSEGVTYLQLAATIYHQLGRLSLEQQTDAVRQRAFRWLDS